MNTTSQLLKDVGKWACIVLLLIIGYQQLATFKNYQEKFLNPIEYTKQVYGNDNVTLYGSRLEEVNKMLAKPTTLCYVGEPVVPNNGTREMHYALTQYYLAPNLLFRNATAIDSVIFNNGASPVIPSSKVCDTVIYNLYSSMRINTATNYHINNGWHITKDFDNGIIILTR